MVNFVLAVDGSAASTRALQYLILIFNNDRDQLHLCTVVQDVPFDWIDQTQLQREYVAEGREMLRNYEATLKENMITNYDLHVLSGEPGERICELATSVNAHFVMMGSRGFSTFAKVFAGSVSEYVLQNARCAVTIIPPAE
eukprot:TRINITY_DN9688_c0_g1_i2.p1 TRINITY_DN9688_c0_g1~~TRINITY_DN9688_c0_g1_i2.p1  ORF type:complete len:141 (-),score=7.48 TRINITY_DN9688_c0_g1_i2:44-466(-)